MSSAYGDALKLFFCGPLQLFYRVTEEKARQAELYLVGMVCYYGKHYSTFFFQTKIRRWMYFDDAHVKEVMYLMPEQCGELHSLTSNG